MINRNGYPLSPAERIRTPEFHGLALTAFTQRSVYFYLLQSAALRKKKIQNKKKRGIDHICTRRTTTRSKQKSHVKTVELTQPRNLLTVMKTNYNYFVVLSVNYPSYLRFYKNMKIENQQSWQSVSSISSHQNLRVCNDPQASKNFKDYHYLNKDILLRLNVTLFIRLVCKIWPIYSTCRKARYFL